MIKLKNVSKFYYSKGVIASGFTKLNLKFNLGEFVAITGESGSGKSTLLNVISGLDTYEEGEMYINGEETSHFSEKDFEDYRRKYIGNIFQNFNLINSYTVYQNIELVLLLNGEKKKDIKERILNLIEEVGLTKYRRTKVSKLSGGQKQRVAIARALAKDTPIIIADEPTGNLDSKSAKGIIELLSEIAKDKLVIVVTHNYDQVENYVTRKIKMHDGKILEDKILKKSKKVDLNDDLTYKNISYLNRIKLGVRNAFNIIPKFLLLFLTFAFITIALISEYASFRKEEYDLSKNGQNGYFRELSDSRVIIKKEDGTTFTKEDYDKVKKLSNVDYIVENDLIQDTYYQMGDNENYWFYGSVKNYEKLDKVDYGNLPKNDNEIVIEGNSNDWYLSNQKDELIGSIIYLSNDNGTLDKSNPLTVVGIKYNDSTWDNIMHVSETIVNKLNFSVNQRYSEVDIAFQNKLYQSNEYSNYMKVIPTNRVGSGQVYVSEELNYLCPNYDCKWKPLDVGVANLNYSDKLSLTITNLYNKKNMDYLLGLKFEDYSGAVFISIDDYNALFNKDSYQSSVFVKDHKLVEQTSEKLNELGYTTFIIKNTKVNNSALKVIQLFKSLVTGVLVIALFFISYFVIKIILKSRNVYYSTIRMLGANSKVSRDLLIIDLLVVANLAFIMYFIVGYLSYNNIINIKFANTVFTYLTWSDFILMYAVISLMSFLISIRYSKKIFEKSAMQTIREEL